MTENKKRIVFDVSPELHQQVKILSALKKVSMNCWIKRAIQDRIAKEAKYDEKSKE